MSGSVLVPKRAAMDSRPGSAELSLDVATRFHRSASDAAVCGEDAFL